MNGSTFKLGQPCHKSRCMCISKELLLYTHIISLLFSLNFLGKYLNRETSIASGFLVLWGTLSGETRFSELHQPPGCFIIHFNYSKLCICCLDVFFFRTEWWYNAKYVTTNYDFQKLEIFFVVCLLLIFWCYYLEQATSKNKPSI